MKDIVIGQKNSKTYKMIVKKKGNPSDTLNGYTVEFMVKKSLDDSNVDAMIIKSGTITNNEVNIVLTPDDTDIPVRKYVYDFKIFNEGFLKNTIVRQFEVRKTVNE